MRGYERRETDAESEDHRDVVSLNCNCKETLISAHLQTQNKAIVEPDP